MTSNMAWRPLAGVKIADFSVLFPGPLTTAVLADLGAEVVKIEPPGGDPARALLPDVFRTVNRNKRSVVLDLKNPEFRNEIQGIAAWADVVIEAFRPGVADRLGIGFGRLAQINPRLVYCSLSGYGQDGPWKDKPGHDLNYLAAAGALAFPGIWGRPPGRSSLPLADIVGGAFAANAILAALYQRDRTGEPARLDLSLFESALYCTALRYGMEDDADTALVPGNDLFETADGVMITLALVEEHFWCAFRELVGPTVPALLDTRLDTIAGRKHHGDELSQILHQTIRSRSAQAWSELLRDSDIPFEICVTPAQAARSEHIRARGRVAVHAGQSFVPFPVTVNSDVRPDVRLLAPDLGEYTKAFFDRLRVPAGEEERDFRGDVR